MTLKPELASDCTASALPAAAAASSSSERYTTHASPSSATRPAATQSLRRDPAASDELCGGGGPHAYTRTQHTSSGAAPAPLRLHDHAIANILPCALSPSPAHRMGRIASVGVNVMIASQIRADRNKSFVLGGGWPVPKKLFKLTNVCSNPVLCVVNLGRLTKKNF